MKTVTVFSVLLLSAAVATIGTTITTTIQIQPAYSQAQHCSGFIISNCITPGQNPTTQTCFGVIACLPPQTITHQEAGQDIRDCHSEGGCTVRPPNQ